MNWDAMSGMGLTMENLEELGALEPLLRGFKTPMLIPVRDGDGDEGNCVDARLQLRLNDRGRWCLRFIGFRKG